MTAPTSDQGESKRASVPATRATFRLEGDVWTIAFGAELCRLRDRAGLRCLAALLRRPGLQVLAADLVVLAGRAARHPASPDRERARARVTHAIRSAMRGLAEHHAALGEHLRATITTDTCCAYRPDPRCPVEWEAVTVAPVRGALQLCGRGAASPQ